MKITPDLILLAEQDAAVLEALTRDADKYVRVLAGGSP